MSEWKPIETAPHDTPVLIFAPETWTDNTKIILVAELISKHNYWNPIGASGWDCEDDLDKPTHWMPLPEPPK